MARVWSEGFEMGDTLFLDNVSNGALTSASARSGSNSYNISSTANSFKNITAASDIYFRQGLRFNTINANHKFLIWKSGSVELGSLRISTATNQLTLYTSTGTLVATGSAALAIDTWYSIEVHVQISDSGTLAVKIDGVADASFSGDTKPGADATITQLAWIKNSGATVLLDDLALNDTTSASDNSWTGDGKIIKGLPNAAGDVTQWTPSAGSNFQNVDDTTPDSDTTYNSASTVNSYDLYNIATVTIPTNHTVTRVYVEARTREEAANGDGLYLGVKTSGSEYWSGSVAQTTTYARYVGTDHKVNPAGSAAWTQSDLDALQIGVKVT